MTWESVFPKGKRTRAPEFSTGYSIRAAGRSKAFSGRYFGWFRQFLVCSLSIIFVTITTLLAFQASFLVQSAHLKKHLLLTENFSQMRITRLFVRWHFQVPEKKKTPEQTKDRQVTERIDEVPRSIETDVKTFRLCLLPLLL